MMEVVEVLVKVECLRRSFRLFDFWLLVSMWVGLCKTLYLIPCQAFMAWSDRKHQKLGPCSLIGRLRRPSTKSITREPFLPSLGSTFLIMWSLNISSSEGWRHIFFPYKEVGKPHERHGAARSRLLVAALDSSIYRKSTL